MKKHEHYGLYSIIILSNLLILWFVMNPRTETVTIKTNLNQFSLSKENVYAYFNVIGIDSTYQSEIMSQILYETGHFCSDVRFRQNNLFGIRIKGEYQKYHHWTESITHWKLIYYDKVKQFNSYYDYLMHDKRYMECDERIYISKLRQIKRWL